MLRETRELFSQYTQPPTRFANHEVHNVFEKTFRDLKRFGFAEIRGKRILDLGCGQRYSFALQCAAEEAKVTALDINYIKPDFLPVAFYRTIRHNGIKRALKSIVRRILWDKGFYKALENSAEKPLKSYQSRINFIVSAPENANYPLPSTSFDLIASIAVLEHVMDVKKFAAEVARLLDHGGYFYAIIHNYFSLSGGHNVEWQFEDEFPSRTVPAWDHLRENRYPAWTYLNQYKPEQYKDAFSNFLSIQHFEGVGINHDPGELEGERFLTPGTHGRIGVILQGPATNKSLVYDLQEDVISNLSTLI